MGDADWSGTRVDAEPLAAADVLLESEAELRGRATIAVDCARDEGFDDCDIRGEHRRTMFASSLLRGSCATQVTQVATPHSGHSILRLGLCATDCWRSLWSLAGPEHPDPPVIECAGEPRAVEPLCSPGDFGPPVYELGDAWNGPSATPESDSLTMSLVLALALSGVPELLLVFACVPQMLLGGGGGSCV